MLARRVSDAQPRAIQAAGTEVTPSQDDPRLLAIGLLDKAVGATVVWVGSPDGDPGLTDAIAAEATRRGGAATPEVEVLVGSWDQPGSRLLDVVTVMDRLRSPGGCPWDAEQTHQSLVPYLIEEAHEAVEALESGDDEHIIEELGDVLLQVAFHARVAAEREDGFDIDDISARLVEKMVHRHPHVFGDVEASDAAAVEANWEQLKAAEKPHREHPLDGIPAGMPELARATKVASRLERVGRGPWLEQWVAESREGSTEEVRVGAQLLAQILAARAAGVDPAAALRTVLRAVAADVPVEPAGP